MRFAWAMAAVVFGASLATAEVTSGPQVGDSVGAFTVTKVAGNPDDGFAVGRSGCYRCKTGSKPVVMVFARSADEKLAKLLKKIDEVAEQIFLHEVLRAQSFWRGRGIAIDLVILNEEAGGYEQPLRERLEGLIQTHSTYTGKDQPGGIFLRSADHIPEEDLTLLRAVASAVMVAARVRTVPPSSGWIRSATVQLLREQLAHP